MLLIKNGRIMDPATETEGVYDMLIDEDRVVRIGMSGTLDDMARESMSMRHDEDYTEIDAGGPSSGRSSWTPTARTTTATAISWPTAASWTSSTSASRRASTPP